MTKKQKEPRYILQKNRNNSKWRVQELKIDSDPRDGTTYEFYETVLEATEKACRDKFNSLLNEELADKWDDVEESKF